MQDFFSQIMKMYSGVIKGKKPTFKYVDKKYMIKLNQLRIRVNLDKNNIN